MCANITFFNQVRLDFEDFCSNQRHTREDGEKNAIDSGGIQCFLDSRASELLFQLEMVLQAHKTFLNLNTPDS